MSRLHVEYSYDQQMAVYIKLAAWPEADVRVANEGGRWLFRYN